eukprot:11393105-Ditylum_brightwellii.AAC.1
MKYPDVMNFPVMLVDMVHNNNGKQLSPAQHGCTIGLKKDLAKYREGDGYVYDKFTMCYDKPQDSQFSSLNKHLKGNDILHAKCSNKENEPC